MLESKINFTLNQHNLFEAILLTTIKCNAKCIFCCEQGTEPEIPIEKMLKYIKPLVKSLGASIVDIELGTVNLKEAVNSIKKRAKCLLSFHELARTPNIDSLKTIARRQQEAGADICKVVTTAQGFEDNLTVLQLISELPEARVISFAMGSLGFMSRVLCPLVGGDFTYASVEQGMESASGQITVNNLRKIYGMMKLAILTTLLKNKLPIEPPYL